MNNRIKARRASATSAALIGCQAPKLSHADERVAEVRMLAPTNADRIGIGGFGWFVDLVGTPNFGVSTDSTVTVHVALAADKTLDGVYNDAPNMMPDTDGNGFRNERDLQAFRFASNVRKATFFINP
jgi:hypothetical protein